MAAGQLIIRKVEVFTQQPSQGNPAAVVLNGKDLPEAEMQRIAAEMNFSETAFVLPARSPGTDLRIRWFTPTCEVSMCGHATIAAIHVLHEADMLPAGASQKGVQIETRGGRLHAVVERSGGSGSRVIVWLDLVPPVLTSVAPEPRLWGPLLGVPHDAFADSPLAVRTQDRDLIVFVADVFSLNNAAPVMLRLAEYSREDGLRGVCVATTATLTRAITVQSRFFAPAFGVDEDPVTGSVHGPLAVHLVKSGLVPMFNDMAALTCTQSSPAGRAGLVRAIVFRRPDGRHDVRIGGQCVNMSG